MLKGTDFVDLVIVTKQSSFLRVSMTRKAASDYIRLWFDVREEIRKMPWWKILLGYLWGFPSWLRPGTFAFNIVPPDADDSYGFWVVDTRHIIGMYTINVMESPQAKLAEAQLKIAEMMFRETNDVQRGEE